MAIPQFIQSRLKFVAFGLYFLALFLIVGKLFFETQFDVGTYAIKKVLFGTEDQAQTLRIGFAQPAPNLDPFSNDSAARPRLMHIYEGLTNIDADLHVVPGLAISFGALDDLTWEFRLRPEVYFHNGKKLETEDVIFSLNRASKSDSAVKDLLSTVSEIKKINENILHIKTRETDPLLASKLAFIFIVSEEGNSGTGPYEIEKNENGILQLKNFEKYWGEKPKYFNVILKTVAKKDEKLKVLTEESVDILANLPADIGSNFSFKNFKLERQPSLEVNFLMFNFNGIFAQQKLRLAVKNGLNTNKLMSLAHGFAVPANQFVANGIFGFNPEIKEKKVIEAENFSGTKFDIDLPKGLEAFGKSLAKQLEEIGLKPNINFLAPDKLSEKILSGKSDFFFFGWKTELGDAFDFLISVAHSRGGDFGAFNGSNYSNSETDNLIELSQKTLDSDERLRYLRSAMKRITEEDIIGIPLFSPEVLYAVSKNVKWTPRVDGYVLAQEVKM